MVIIMRDAQKFNTNKEFLCWKFLNVYLPADSIKQEKDTIWLARIEV